MISGLGVQLTSAGLGALEKEVVTARLTNRTINTASNVKEDLVFMGLSLSE
jgi:hypothetical protein